MCRRLLIPSRLALKVAARPSLKTVDSRAMVLALVVAGFSGVGAGQALTRHVGCGDTITTDTTLDSDLVNCPNNGIVIGADNIILDLNGHTIDGDGRRVDSCPEGEDCDVGMFNRTGYNGLTFVGGTIRQFGVGILVHGGAAHPCMRRKNGAADIGAIGCAIDGPSSGASGVGRQHRGGRGHQSTDRWEPE